MYKKNDSHAQQIYNAEFELSLQIEREKETGKTFSDSDLVDAEAIQRAGHDTAAVIAAERNRLMVIERMRDAELVRIHERETQTRRAGARTG